MNNIDVESVLLSVLPSRRSYWTGFDLI